MAQSRSTNNREFRVFLLNIAREITTDVLERLIFLCHDDLPKGELSSIKLAQKFLELLWREGKIWPEDMSYLTNHLETAGNKKLANDIREKEPAPRRSNVPRQTCHFIGRDAIVNEIITNLTTDSSHCHMAILVALPGMGKTEVAIRVGHLLQDQNWPVLFIERQENLLELCHEILYHLTNRRWTTSDTNTVSHAKRKLSEMTEDTIIILDNTENIQGKEFDEFIKYLVRSAPKVRVIITTQQDIGFVSPGNVLKIRLDPLDSPSSAELITRIAPNAKNDAKELGELFGGIPLFLNCASSLMADGFNPKVFAQQLRQNPSRVLRDSEHITTFYQDMGRFLLHKFPKHVLKNLVRLSVFPSSFSAVDIQFLFDDEYQLEDVKTKLFKCCLLQRVNDELWVVHPLIQTYCKEERQSLSLEDEGRDAEHSFNLHYLELLRSLHRKFITKDSSSSSIISFRKNKPNIMEALKNCLDDTSKAEEKEFAIDVANEVVDFLAKILSPPMECTELYQKCCQIARNSPDQKRLADCLNSCGFRRLEDVAHGKDDQTACQMFQEAYQIWKKLPEEEQKCEKHAHTTTKLGLCVLLQGDVERGRQLIHEGIALRKELGIPLYVAAGYCDLGHSYRHCHEYNEAAKIWQTETLPIYKECLGDHPWTASILQHIAFAFKSLAEEDPTAYADQAERFTKEALDLRKRLLGVHQDTARSHVHLSRVYHDIQDKLSLALTELEKALEIQEDVVGIQQDTIDTLDFMAKILTKQGRGEEAEKRMEQALYYREKLESRLT